MTLGEWLPGRARWLMRPSTFGNSALAVLAASWASLTLELPAGGLSAFILAVIIVAGVWVSAAELWATRWVPTFRELASGVAPPTPAAQAVALREVKAFAMRVALLTIFVWGCAAVSLAAVVRLLLDFPWPACGRLVVMGGLFGPMAAVVVGLSISRRALEASEWLAEGLSPAVAGLALGDGPSSVRHRLVAFTVVMAALPAVMLADVGLRVGDRATTALVAATPAQRPQVLAAFHRELLLDSAGLSVLVLAMAVLAARVGAEVLAGPMRRVADVASRLAQGHLPPARLIAADGEVWAVTRLFSDMHDRLYRVIGLLQGAGGRIAGGATALQEVAEQFGRGASEQAAALHQTTATTEALAHSARQIAASAATVLDQARQALEAADSGRAMAEAIGAAVGRMQQDNQAIAGAVGRLTGRVQQVGQIIEFITAVADRTELLALSAELEGTRAGDAGRGFTLVANELRSLAENVKQSTREIEELIEEVREATRSTSEATRAASATTAQGTRLARDVAGALETVAGLAQESSNAVRTITLATQQQQSGTDQLAEAMADVLTITQAGLGTTRELAQASEQLGQFARALEGMVQRYRGDA